MCAHQDLFLDYSLAIVSSYGLEKAFTTYLHLKGNQITSERLPKSAYKVCLSMKHTLVDATFLSVYVHVCEHACE